MQGSPRHSTRAVRHEPELKRHEEDDEYDRCDERGQAYRLVAHVRSSGTRQARLTRAMASCVREPVQA